MRCCCRRRSGSSRRGRRNLRGHALAPHPSLLSKGSNPSLGERGGMDCFVAVAPLRKRASRLSHAVTASELPIERRMAIATPPNRLTTQRRLCCTGLAAMRMGAAMMRLSDLQLTPARVGLFLLMLLLLGAIFVRIIAASEDSDVRPPTTPENSARVTPDTTGAVRGLRGSLQ